MAIAVFHQGTWNLGVARLDVAGESLCPIVNNFPLAHERRILSHRAAV